METLGLGGESRTGCTCIGCLPAMVFNKPSNLSEASVFTSKHGIPPRLRADLNKRPRAFDNHQYILCPDRA